MCHKTFNTDRRRNGDIPQIDPESNQNGNRVVTPTEPLPESSRERRDGPGGE